MSLTFYSSMLEIQQQPTNYIGMDYSFAKLDIILTASGIINLY